MVTRSRITNRALTRRARRNMEHMSKGIRHHLKPTKKSNILRPKQIPIVFAVAQKIEEGSDAVYLDLPTGIGKTVIASQIINSVMLDGWHPKVLIVTYSKELVKQTKEAFEEHAPDVPVGLYYQDEKDTNQAVTVTTYASFPHFAKNFAEQYDYVIYDEGHKALSDERLELMKNFKNANTIALTASPAYTVDKTLEDHFDLAYKMTVPEAIDNDLICSYRNIQVDTDYVDLDKVKLSNNGDYEKRSLAKALDIYSRNKAAVEFYQSSVDPETGKSLLGKRGIVNCVDIQHATNVAKLFNKHIKRTDVDGKIPAAVVHGKMPKAQREKILQDHKDGKILLLVNADLLIEGYDDPTIELCLNLAPSRSIVRVSQRAGRALRLDKNNPNKVALIVDFMDQTSIEKQKGLLYGDVAGGAAYFHPRIEREKRNYTPAGKTQDKKVTAVDQEFLKRLKVFWSSKEVNSIIKNNRTIREQGSLLGRKQEDEIFALEIARKYKISQKIVQYNLNKLIPVKGKEGQYIDPEDKNKKPTIYQGAERTVAHGTSRCLKIKDMEKFVQNCILKNRKQKDEFNAYDIIKKYQASQKIYEEIGKLIPIKRREGQYIHTDDKSKNPNIYHGAMRIIKGKNQLCLKVADVPQFLNDWVLKNKKQENVFSPRDISKKYKVSYKIVREETNKLMPVKGKEGQYIHADDKGKKPIIYHGKVYQTYNAKFLCLEEKYVQSFLDNHILKDRKRESELSGNEIAKKYKLAQAPVKNGMQRLKLLKGKIGQYIDSKDKSKNPIIYYGTERIINGEKKLCLEEKSVLKFLEKCVLENRKQRDESTYLDIAKEKKIPKNTLGKAINRLIPLKGKEDQYIDPEDKSKNPIIYHVATRSILGKQVRCIKNKDVPTFLQKCLLTNKKQENELSSGDLTKIFVISNTSACELYKTYKPLKEDSNLYIHSAEKFKETIEMVTRKSNRGSILCLKENYVDIFAQQNDLEYRDPEMKKKYQTLAAKNQQLE